MPGVGNLLFTSVHEVWPGHFLQFLHANRAPSKFGQVFVGYAFAEGWAHYAEEMLWEMGLGEGLPELHIGQLTAAVRTTESRNAWHRYSQPWSLWDPNRPTLDRPFSNAGMVLGPNEAQGAPHPTHR